MSVREYIGARYVPVFAEPIVWDKTKSYEPLTIVLYQGNSFTTRQHVPAGIEITDERYWAETGNYNAQVEAYRTEVLNYTEAIAGLEEDVEEMQGDGWVTTSKLADDAVTHDKLAEAAVTSININDGAIGLVDLNQNVHNRILNKTVRYSKFVFIGDSYGNGVGGSGASNSWVASCVGYLGISSDQYINVSNSGAGFVAEGHSSGLSGLTFGGQVDYAYNNLPSDWTADEVDFVIIGGGYNDHAQEGISTAARQCVRNAQTKFPNAKVCFFPLVAGSVELNTEFHTAYYRCAEGCAIGGAAVFFNSLYWMYPYEEQTSAVDGIHCNDTGYSWMGIWVATSILGGVVPAYAMTYGQSAEGFSLADGVSSGGFRTGVDNGIAWFGGKLTRTGAGDLCTLPSYCRPRQTMYFLAFVYADTTHEGVARIRVTTNGEMSFFKQETGDYDSTLAYDVYIDTRCIPLGHDYE